MKKVNFYMVFVDKMIKLNCKTQCCTSVSEYTGVLEWK